MTSPPPQELRQIADEIEKSDGLYCLHASKESRGWQLGIKKTAMVITALRAVAEDAEFHTLSSSGSETAREAIARRLAKWIGYAWDGMRDYSIFERGLGEWTSEHKYQGGKPDLLKLADEFIALLRSGDAVQQPITRDDMALISASEAACYRWPEDTAEHRVLRAAFVDGAGHIETDRGSCRYSGIRSAFART